MMALLMWVERQLYRVFAKNRTVCSRPNFGRYTKANKVIAAAAAFRRPSPPSEQRQLGGMRTGLFQVIKARGRRST
jgi:hypothetical protein